MPLIEVSWLPGRSEEHKTEIVRKFTDAMCEVLPIQRDQVTVIFHEVALGDWWKGDRPVMPKPKADNGDLD